MSNTTTEWGDTVWNTSNVLDNNEKSHLNEEEEEILGEETGRKMRWKMRRNKR